MKLTVKGVRYRVETEGSGPALLLLHGFTGASDNWIPFIPGFSLRFRTIRVDIIGHGGTESPPHPARYAMDRAALDLAGVLDALGEERAHMLGYSMGGRLALSFALLHPERVRSLVLESASPGLKMPAEREERVRRDEVLADRIEAEGIGAFVDRWERIPLFESQQRLPEAVRRAIREQRLANDPRGLANSLRGMGTGAQPSRWGELHRLHLPVLLLTGEWDAKFRRIAGEMAEVLPDVRSETITGAGHTVHVEQPRLFGTMVMDFLSKDSVQGR